MSTIAEKLTTIAENEQKVYDKGAEDASIKFWNGFTNNRTRLTYTKAFQYMNFSEMTIPNGLVLSNEMVFGSMFVNYFGTSLPLGIDMSNVNLNLSRPQSPAYRMFQGCDILNYVYDMQLPATGYYNFAFAYCYELETIEMIRSNQTSDFSNAFEECYKLKNITFDGVIGKDINFQYSPLLTIESMKNIVSHLANYSGTENAATYTLTFTDACWEALEASGKPYDDGLTTDETLTWKNYVISLGWNV